MAIRKALWGMAYPKLIGGGNTRDQAIAATQHLPTSGGSGLVQINTRNYLVSLAHVLALVSPRGRAERDAVEAVVRL